MLEFSFLYIFYFPLVDEIVITAGFGGSLLTDTETIRIYKNGTLSQSSCPLPDYPLNVFGAAGSIYSFQSKESKIIICGGGGYNSKTNKCYKFNPSTWAWDEVKPMKNGRSHHVMTTMSDGTIMTCGGLNASGILGTTKSCEKFNGNWERIAPLPKPLFGNCLVYFNATTTVSIGGGDGHKVRES